MQKENMTENIMTGVILFIMGAVTAITFGIILKRQDWHLITAISIIPTYIGIMGGAIGAEEKKKNEESKNLIFLLSGAAVVAIFISATITSIVNIIATLSEVDWITYIVTSVIVAIIAAIVAFIWTRIVMSKK